MKLIHSGKILADDSALATAGIKETDFLVVMAKAAPKEAAASPPAATATPSEPAAAATPSTPAPAVATTPSADTGPTPTSDSAPSVGTPAQVEQIVGMGFTAEQAQQALRAAFGNSARAVEYLMNPGSMPAEMETETAQSSTPAAAPPAEPATAAPAASDGDGDGPGELSPDSPLYPLLNNPSFVQLRGFVQREPNVLPALLQELVRQEPNLVRLLNDNREDFYRLLNTPIDAGAAGAGGPGGPGGRGVQQIRITPEEDEAINRLVMITGQSKSAVAEAYFACDKNEELAANYLLENAFGN